MATGLWSTPATTGAGNGNGGGWALRWLMLRDLPVS